MTTLSQQAARGAQLRAAMSGGTFRAHALRAACSQCGGVHGNERGQDDDPRQIVADLISNNASPFKPEHVEALGMLGTAALIRLRDTYLGTNTLHVNTAIHVNADDPEVVAMSTHLSASRSHDAHAHENAGKLYRMNGSRPFVHATPRLARVPAPPLGGHVVRGEQADADELAGMNFAATNHAAYAKHRRWSVAAPRLPGPLADLRLRELRNQLIGAEAALERFLLDPAGHQEVLALRPDLDARLRLKVDALRRQVAEQEAACARLAAEANDAMMAEARRLAAKQAEREFEAHEASERERRKREFIANRMQKRVAPETPRTG